MEISKEGKRKKVKNSHEDENRSERDTKKFRKKSKSPPSDRQRDSRRKRRHSKSKSPDIPTKQDKQIDSEIQPDVKKEAPTRRAKETDMLNTRTGGAYIPPARLRMMQAQITDKSSVPYQRLAWEALKKSIHGHINKINVGNIGIIIKELLKENIVRGRGLLCRSVIQAQAASPTFTNVYAALVAAVNSRFPNIGELLLKRLVIQFKRGFKRNDKSICISSASFIAHLVNQRVAHEILALELLTLLVETPTDDSVEVAIAFLKECGQKLTEVSSKGVNAIFEMLRNILHEGQLDKRVQYMIEVMFQVWKDGFKDHPALIEELELVPEEEQFTHLMMLDEATDPQDILNVFKFDEKYEENEQKYKTLSKEILGSEAESGEEGSSGESGSDEDDDDEEAEQKAVTIIDNTETNLIALRRTIYLTINSSLDFEECAHKLMKMQLKPGQEVELCHMFLDCCAEQRTYEKFYGLLAQRFCNINRMYIGPFEEIFKDSYATAHRLDTNRLRNVSKFFAHLLFTDSISWEVLECVKLNEEDTTSSSRIYIKILFQELAEYMGLKKLNDRLKDPTLQDAFSGLFPRDNPKNTRFSINFFTSIGLGGLTDELREHLKQMPKNMPPPAAEINIDSESSSSDSSSSSSDSSSGSSSSSEDKEAQSKQGKNKKNRNKDKKEQETLAAQVAKEKDERWGHDGYYDTYGKDARRMDSRSGREDLHRPRDRRYDQKAGVNDKGGLNNDREQNKDSVRRKKKKDDSINNRNKDESGKDKGRNRNDDRAERDLTGRKDNENRLRRDFDRNRQIDEREERNSNRIREDNGRQYQDSDRNRDLDNTRYERAKERSKRDGDDFRKIYDRARRDDERNKKDDEESRKNDDKRRDGNETHKDTSKESRDKSRYENNENERLNEHRRYWDSEKTHEGYERSQIDERRKVDNREQKCDKYRKDSDRYRKEKDRPDEEKEKRGDNRSQRNKDKEYSEDRHQKGDDKSRRTDDIEHGNDNTHKRDEVCRKEQDKLRPEEDKSRSKIKSSVVHKKHKVVKRSEKRRTKNDKTQSDSSSSDSSSSSDDENSGPGRYWDDFDIKAKAESLKHQKVQEKKRREHS